MLQTRQTALPLPEYVQQLLVMLAVSTASQSCELCPLELPSALLIELLCIRVEGDTLL